MVERTLSEEITMSIIDAVKRLERAGSESSQMTLKLKQAAHETAQLIFDSVSKDVEIPRIDVETFLNDPQNAEGLNLFDKYTLFIIYGTKDNRKWERPAMFVDLKRSDEDNIWEEDLLHPDMSRYTAMAFADHIATGLLDDVADRIELQNATLKSMVDGLRQGDIADDDGREFRSLVESFMCSVNVVFGTDWDKTLGCITAPHFIRAMGSFLEPGVEDESSNWWNRGAFLSTFRRLQDYMRQHGMVTTDND